MRHLVAHQQLGGPWGEISTFDNQASLWPRTTAWIQAWRDLYECPWPTAGAIKDRYGDLGLALAMWAARRYTGLTLKDIGAALDGFDYAAVAICPKSDNGASVKSVAG